MWETMSLPLGIEELETINWEKISPPLGFKECMFALDELSKTMPRIFCEKPEDAEDSGIIIHSSVEKLSFDHLPNDQFQAAATLAIIAFHCSKCAELVIDAGAVPYFIKLLRSPHDAVQQMAVLALGNVASDSPSNRDSVLKEGALIPLLELLNESATIQMLRCTTCTLLNFCRGKPGPSFEQVGHALPALQILVSFEDEEVLTNACWALSYLSDGTTKDIQAVMEAGVCPQLVKLLAHPLPRVLIPALLTLRNIARGGDFQRRCILRFQVLPSLRSLLLRQRDITIAKEACSIVSAISAGDQKQIQALLDAQLIEPLISLLKDGESDIQEEAGQAVINFIAGGTRNGINGQYCRFIRLY